MRDLDRGRTAGESVGGDVGDGGGGLIQDFFFFKPPNKMCFDGGPLFVLSRPLCPAFITASGGKQMGHNKSLTIKRGGRS